MLLTLYTDKTVSEAAVALESAVAANQFGVMAVHNLTQSMANKGVRIEHECRIFEVCQPQLAKRTLDEDMRVSAALPCRISVYSEDGKTVLATLRPTSVMALFRIPGLESVAREAEAGIVKIMLEAAIH